MNLSIFEYIAWAMLLKACYNKKICCAWSSSIKPQRKDGWDGLLGIFFLWQDCNSRFCWIFVWFLQNGNWADSTCDEKHGFICKKRSASEPTGEEIEQNIGCKSVCINHLCFFFKFSVYILFVPKNVLHHSRAGKGMAPTATLSEQKQKHLMRPKTTANHWIPT